MSSKVHIYAEVKAEAETGLFFTAYKKGKTKELVLKGAPKEIAQAATAAFGEDFKSEANEIFLIRHCSLSGYKNLIFCGLGDASKVSQETMRSAAGVLARDLHINAKKVHINFENLSSYHKDKSGFLEAFVEGSILGGYRFEELKDQNKENKKKDVQTDLIIVCKNKTELKSNQKTIEYATKVSVAVNFARRLGDMPGNLMTPTILAEETVKAAKGLGIKVTVWDSARIQKEKMGNFWGVAKGSAEPAKFIIMEYKGAGAKQKPVCFVGKGLTFDSGGVSIKPGAGMEEMKYDMCGGANVIAATIALAKLKAKVNVLTFVPATENLPGPNANKPGDITIARNGLTTEVNNTDAEGRLILSDALVYASEHDPAFIVDAATLTGAMAIALGDTHVGYFTNNEKLKKAIETCAAEAHERIWHLPLVKEHHDDMKGTYGDLSNISSGRGAGSAKGAAYLAAFVKPEIPWAHFDIAGTAWNTGSRLTYNPKKGANGVMVRTFVKLAESWKA